MKCLNGCGILLALAATGCSRSFTAADATTKLVFQAGPEVSEQDRTTLQRVVEARLRQSRIVPEFAVETTSDGELDIFLPRLETDAGSAIQSLVIRPGTLEFAILVNIRDHATLIQQLEQSTDGTVAGTQWVPVAVLPSGKPVEITVDGNPVTRETERDGRIIREFLVVLAEPEKRITDQLLTSASLEEGTGGRPALGFSLSEHGSLLMRDLTVSALPTPDGFMRRLGIILDGTLISAPHIQAVVDGQGIIEGEFTQEEIEQTIWCLNAGRLPVPIQSIGAEDVGSGG